MIPVSLEIPSLDFTRTLKNCDLSVDDEPFLHDTPAFQQLLVGFRAADRVEPPAKTKSAPVRFLLSPRLACCPQPAWAGWMVTLACVTATAMR